MIKTTLCILAILTLANVCGWAQKSPKAKPVTKAINTAPVMPLEVRIGYHRMRDKAIFLKVENRDSKRSIKMVNCTILIMDSVKQEMIKGFTSVDFEYPTPIAPLKSGLSVITEEDVVRLNWDNHLPGRCLDYIADPSKERGKTDVFIPSRCSNDLLGVIVHEVTFTDGSKWQ
jgi:hypothetical protein